MGTPRQEIFTMKRSRIYLLRKKLGWKQPKIATYFGVTRTTISRWENKHYKPSDKHEAMIKQLELLATDQTEPEMDNENNQDNTIDHPHKIAQLQYIRDLGNRLKSEGAILVITYYGGIQKWFTSDQALPHILADFEDIENIEIVNKGE